MVWMCDMYVPNYGSVTNVQDSLTECHYKFECIINKQGVIKGLVYTCLDKVWDQKKEN